MSERVEYRDADMKALWEWGIGRLRARVERLARELRLRLLRRTRLDLGRLEPGRWWNGSLRSADQLQTAGERARSAGLPLSGDSDRDWDALESLEVLMAHCESSARIADIGLHEHRPLLEWLDVVGYRRPLNEELRLRADRARSVPAAAAPGEPLLWDEQASDETAGGGYDAVICRSLPGDRVGLSERLLQAERLLRPGGLLILSTEFWDMPTPYQGGERRCASDYFCCRDSVHRLMELSDELGLVPVAPVFLGAIPENRHPGLLGVGVGPLKLAFRKL